MKIQIGTEIRDATPDEVAAHESSIAQGQHDQTIADNRNAARASARTKLIALGLNEAEIASLAV